MRKVIKILSVRVSKPQTKAPVSAEERKALVTAGVQLCKAAIRQSKSGRHEASPYPTTLAA